MGVGDIRYTVLQVVQECFRKLGLDTPTSLSANKLSVEMVDLVNDVVNEISDFGNWPETLVSANVSAVNAQRDYVVSTSANIKNFGDIYFSQRSGALRNVTIEDMRIRTSANGLPSQFTIFGTDASSGNPILRFHPIPVSGAGSDGYFSVLYWIRPPLYTTSDGSTIIPFPARVVVLGVLAKQILNESGGAPSDRYNITNNDYVMARKEALNRFKGDTGWTVSFIPRCR